MRNTFRYIAVLLSGLVAIAGVQAQEILIRNANIVDGSEVKTIALKDILIRGDSIAAVGNDLSASDNAQVIDASGRPVTAGLFNAQTQLGLREVSAVDESVDAASENPMVTASLMIADAYNPSSVAVPYNRMLGVTHGLLQPSKSEGLFAGTAAVVHLTDSRGVLVEKAAMVVDLGDDGSELAGGSRAAAMALLREAIEDARDYSRNRESYNSGNRRDYKLSRHDLDALIPVVQRRMPMLVRVERAADISRVLKFAKDYRLTLILSGVREGWRVADEIAAAKVPVILDPINNLPTSYETLGARLDNAKLMHEAGVTMMFTGMGWQTTHNAYLVRQSAGNAVANGLPYHIAIQAITVNPARIFGLPGYGQIEKGGRATLVIWSGDPLEVMSNPDLVMIDGQQYPLVSRATRLRDRYYKRIKTSQ